MPRIKQTELSKFTTWWSDCGRYRIGRTEPTSSYPPSYFAHEGKEITIKSDLPNLAQAIHAVAAYHAKRHNLESVDTNEDQLLDKFPAYATKAPVAPDSNEESETPVPKKPKKEVDRFNMRIGSRAARINQMITDKWKSMEQIKKEAKEPNNITSHLNKLLEKGFIEKKMADGKTFFRIKATASPSAESHKIALERRPSLKERIAAIKARVAEKKKMAKAKEPR